MPKAKKKRVEQPEQPEAEEDEGSIEEEDPESEPEPEEEPVQVAPAVPRRTQHRLELLAQVRATALLEREESKNMQKATAAYNKALEKFGAKGKALAACLHRAGAPSASQHLSMIHKAEEKWWEADRAFLRASLQHAAAKIAAREASIAFKDATMRDLRARIAELEK